MALERPKNLKKEEEEEGFLVHVLQLGRMRDAAMEKMRVDQQRLVQLGNLLNASIETKELREQSDLEVDIDRYIHLSQVLQTCIVHIAFLFHNVD